MSYLPLGASPVGHPTSPKHGRPVAHSRLESVNEKTGLDSDDGASTAALSMEGDDGGNDPTGGDQRSTPHVHMDAMAFGMGCCCLQVTFQVCLWFVLDGFEANNKSRVQLVKYRMVRADVPPALYSQNPVIIPQSIVFTSCMIVAYIHTARVVE